MSPAIRKGMCKLSELPYLRQLESESMHIFREVAAEFRNPVMLFSAGKDSTVLLHLALKAFYPEKPPFPLLHIDTTWKFRETIAFRDWRVRECGVELLVHTNQDGVDMEECERRDRIRASNEGRVCASESRIIRRETSHGRGPRMTYGGQGL